MGMTTAYGFTPIGYKFFSITNREYGWIGKAAIRVALD